MRNCVPAGWENTKIKQLVDGLQYGYTAKADTEALGPRFLRITDIDDGQIDWSSVPGCGIEPDSFAKYELADGDIVFARTGSIDKACMVRQPPQAVFASYLIRGRPQIRELSEWLHHFLQSTSYRRQALELSAGIGRANINAKSIGEIELPIAPLHEQQRIVEAIESYLTRLDDAVASLERVQRNLERYRASVLKAAVEGRLVEPEGEIAMVPLGELIEGLGQGWSPRCDLSRVPETDEWAVIKTTAIQSMRYNGGECKPLPASLQPRLALEIHVGDMLMTRKGPRKRAGVACLVRATRRHSMICDTVYRFRCREARAVPAYLELALNSPAVMREIDTKKSGISDSGVSLTHRKLQSVMIPLPTIADQERIASAVAEAVSRIDVLARTVESCKRRESPLRQAILKWAFEGKLVEQDPNDEPASALLERIKAERDEAKTDKPSRRRKRGSAE